jgi:hypothetical protein
MNIDKNVPLPERAMQARDRKYRWRSMEIGDSFLFPKGFAYKSGRAAAAKAGKRTGQQFITRVINCRLRVWRVG